VPSASLTIADGSAAINMTWGAANGNGRDVQKYIWTLSDGRSGETGATSASATGKVGTSYTFTAKAVGPGGDGEPSDPSAARTAAPGAPSSANASVGNKGDKTVTMKWGTAQSTGTAVDNYQTSINGGGWENRGTATEASFQGEFDTAYSFRVRAVTAGATGGETQSNSVTPQKQDPPGGTITGRTNENIACDGGNKCEKAIFTMRNQEPGTYTAKIQTLNSAGNVTWTASSSATVSGNGGTAGGWVADPGAGSSVRVVISGGPSGTFYTDPVSRETWLGFG